MLWSPLSAIRTTIGDRGAPLDFDLRIAFGLALRWYRLAVCPVGLSGIGGVRENLRCLDFIGYFDWRRGRGGCRGGGRIHVCLCTPAASDAAPVGRRLGGLGGFGDSRR
jgi:hypothetical protein